MVNGIPIYKVKFGEEYIAESQASSDKIFGYCIEAHKGPIGEPIYIPSNSEALRIFGVNFAPHFYQKGSGIYICRVPFKGAVAPSITYKAKVADSGNDTVDVVKITATTPGTVEHQVNIVKSNTSDDRYNLVVTIEGVGSKKYQNIPTLEEVVKRINSKFADYIVAELLFDEQKALALENDQKLVKVSQADGTYKFEVKESNATLGANDVLYATGPFKPTRLQANQTQNGTVLTTLSGGSNGKVLNKDGTQSSTEIPNEGVSTITETGDLSIDTTLINAYREAFKIMEDIDVIGIATLSKELVVQNELVEHIERMIDPETYKYRFGITAFLDYNPNATNVHLSDLTNAAIHIDNPFVVMIGQGVVFEEEGSQYNLLPYQAVQLYTGLRSALNYGESIFGGNSKKVLIGVKDKLPLTTDGYELTREDIEQVNEKGLITFKKEYKEITFLEGVTTAQENPVLSHESVMMIVLHVLKRLIRVSKPFQGENVTEDLKTSLVNALSNELKNITDTDKTLVALEDYNIPPYAVEVQATVMAGFNDAGEYIRETHYLAIVKIVPVGALRSITLSVIVI